MRKTNKYIMKNRTNLLDEVVLALVAEDDMDLLGAGTANVGAKHDVVWGVSMHIGLVQGAVKHLDVAAAAVNVLLVLHSELHNHWLVPVTNPLLFTVMFLVSHLIFRKCYIKIDRTS